MSHVPAPVGTVSESTVKSQLASAAEDHIVAKLVSQAESPSYRRSQKIPSFTKDERRRY